MRHPKRVGCEDLYILEVTRNSASILAVTSGWPSQVFAGSMIKLCLCSDSNAEICLRK